MHANSQKPKMNKGRVKITNAYDSVTDEEKDELETYDANDPINSIESLIN